MVNILFKFIIYILHTHTIKNKIQYIFKAEKRKSKPV